MPPAATVTLAQFFDGRPDAAALFDVVRAAIQQHGRARMRVTKSQIAFSRRRGFAWVWTPDRYLRGETAPLVISVALSRRDRSPRWKQVVEPTPGRWMHHLEVRAADEIDGEVAAWLAEAAAEAD
ncbi:MAG: hypothetical protein EPO65_09610 [Dehalococcoidia bacterium]|nr:MAG: hypothetical protein EPO65_09610 [Dehalococcoidia bacterium]